MVEYKVVAEINGVKESFTLKSGKYIDFSEGLPDIRDMIVGYAQGRYGMDAKVGSCSWGLK